MKMNRFTFSFFFIFIFNLLFLQVDSEGIEENDIQLVMSQSKASRSKAIKALRKCNNDIVNAIMVCYYFHFFLNFIFHFLFKELAE